MNAPMRVWSDRIGSRRLWSWVWVCRNCRRFGERPYGRTGWLEALREGFEHLARHPQCLQPYALWVGAPPPAETRSGRD